MPPLTIPAAVCAPRAPFLTRLAGVLGCTLLIGAGIAVVREQSLWYTWIYSVCISLLCWLCIDVGRLTVVGLQRYARGAEHQGEVSRWPGWPAMLAVITVGSLLGLAGGTQIADLLTGEHSDNLFGRQHLRDFLAAALYALLPAAAITYWFRSRAQLADREALAQAALRLAAESRLRLLEAQLEPHMFFNTLANLHVLIGLDPPRAQAMLERLIAFLRATLSGSQLTTHALHTEFSRIEDYLALMQIRMGDRLQTTLLLPAELAALPVPPLLLQPLVENSIKHGLEPSLSGGHIKVGAERCADQLVLTVRDTGVGLKSGPSQGTRFGLHQVRERLMTLYGAGASFELAAAADGQGGTVATVRLPAG